MHRRPRRPQWHWGGVQADRAVEAGKLAGRAHFHRRLEQVCDQFPQGLLPGCHLSLGEPLAQYLELFVGQDLVLRLGRGVDDRQHQAEQVTDLTVAGQERLPARRVPFMPSRALQLSGKHKNNTLAAAFRCRGRSSTASNNNATKTARTLRCLGRPVCFFMSLSIPSATPELSITSVQKEIASSDSAEVKMGTWRPWLIVPAASFAARPWNLAPLGRGGRNAAATRPRRYRLYRAVPAEASPPPSGHR